MAGACICSDGDTMGKSESVVWRDAGGEVGQIVASALWVTRSCNRMLRKKLDISDCVMRDVRRGVEEKTE